MNKKDLIGDLGDVVTEDMYYHFRQLDKNGKAKTVRKTVDTTWLTAQGEVIPIPNMTDKHLVFTGRRLEKDAKKKFDSMISDLEVNIELAQKENKTQRQSSLEGRRNMLLSKSRVQYTAYIFPKYLSLHREAVNRGLLERNVDFHKFIQRQASTKGGWFDE